MEEKQARADDTTIFIGKKPTMSYVLAAITQFVNSNEIHSGARGRNISTAGDVAEVGKNRFVQNVNSPVQIGTEKVTDKENRTLNVSKIDITLKK